LRARLGSMLVSRRPNIQTGPTVGTPLTAVAPIGLHFTGDCA
jgi:hypothetical protein